MGGHGAWILAGFGSQDAVCVSAAAGWLRKENYGDANAFFNLDNDGSSTDPGI